MRTREPSLRWAPGRIPKGEEIEESPGVEPVRRRRSRETCSRPKKKQVEYELQGYRERHVQ